jgi:hypothetical protein
MYFFALTIIVCAALAFVIGFLPVKVHTWLGMPNLSQRRFIEPAGYRRKSGKGTTGWQLYFSRSCVSAI